MKVNIWSDVRCPFCYIGKRKFEMALEQFAHKDEVDVIWHSFELDPGIETVTDKSAIEYLAEAKGISLKQAEGMRNNVNQIAQEVGLDFNYSNTIVANSFNAHRLIQLAKTKGFGNEIEEELFKAHFTDGKNIDDKDILAQIAVSVGIDEKEAKVILSSDAFTKEVRADEMQAQTLGVRGVPFFVLNKKYGVSGAQSPETFLDVLNKTWEEMEKETAPIVISEEASCDVDGNCS